MAIVNTVIVPFDFSDAAVAALRFASDLAVRESAELLVLHGMIVPAVHPASPGYSRQDVIDGLHQHLTEKLRSVMAARGFSGRTLVRPEPVQDWIGDIIDASDNPLVVISRHGWTRKTAGIGRNAKRILQIVDAPLFLHQGVSGKDEVEHVLAAVAFDDKSTAVVAKAVEIAQSLQARLTLVHVVDTIAEIGYFGEVGWSATDYRQEEFLESARKEVAQMAAQAGGGSFAVEHAVVMGTITHALQKISAEKNASLVVCGKHSRGAVTRFFLGSTPEDLTRSYEGHLLIVP